MPTAQKPVRGSLVVVFSETRIPLSTRLPLRGARNVKLNALLEWSISRYCDVGDSSPIADAVHASGPAPTPGEIGSPLPCV
jgi:hypothetical protein